MQVQLVFPHQLYDQSEIGIGGGDFYIIESDIFFLQYQFHQQKLLFHRASMKYYAKELTQKKYHCHYIDAKDPNASITTLVNTLKSKGVQKIKLYDPCDYLLDQQLKKASKQYGIELIYMPSPNFLNNKQNSVELLGNKKTYFQTSFYTEQRKQRKILLESDGSPVGGQWSFDAENRKKIPKNTPIPTIHFFESNEYIEEAKQYVKANFKNNPGKSDAPFNAGHQDVYYPVTHADAKKAMDQFIAEKLDQFGIYEDAMVVAEKTLFHSVLSPLINVGLIQPADFLNALLQAYQKGKAPINSIEGIIRQIIGWREFVQLTYRKIGGQQRTKNFWGFTKKMPQSFYDGTTGIVPIDTSIKKLLESGYNHHIERLMVIGNFMLLCEIAPDAVYQWFMEMYIDAYDWVMVPNVYGMSQFADGGMITTKPYICGSNYLMKMGDFPKGEWQAIWDGLFWRFLSKQRVVFAKNPRWAMLLSTWDKMPEEKRSTHLSNAEQFLLDLK
jgi:deoxyribodipyrimidine photolyase-related protein